MDAKCTNCDHEWTLRKEPDEYSGGGPRCPKCDSTAVRPARSVPQKAEPAQEAPATESAGFDSLEDTGRELARVRNAGPEEKAKLEGMAFSAVAELLKGFGQQHAEEKLESVQRSKEHGGEIQKANEYASCAECGKPIKNLPPEGTEFQCPHCRTVLKI